MAAPAILLRSTADLSPSSSSSPGAGAEAGAISIDSDMVVILASLLCALICVAGLALLARCACRRTAASPAATASSTFSHLPPPPPHPPIKSKGLKKKAIDALPTVAFAASQGQGECAICLAEFAAGEDLRVLPHCAHGFHVACIDTWLGAHATCPSCRATIGSSPTPPLPGRCRRCGATCDDDVDVTSAGASAAAGDESFLP